MPFGAKNFLEFGMATGTKVKSKIKRKKRFVTGAANGSTLPSTAPATCPAIGGLPSPKHYGRGYPPLAAQDMLLDFAADKVINKYQTATCEQLKAQKDEPRTDREKMAIEFLRNDSQARVAFIDKVAAPILNKMFECGLIP
jgi:uncharacterized protein YifE (UPF0438 family)